MHRTSASSSAPPPPPPPLPADGLLAPGFRFHPTDEELVSYYLKRRVRGQPLRVDAIAEVDLYKCEPRDLPALSRLRSRDLEWYFFSPLDRKYSSRSRTNRATDKGYWKTTGKDRPVRRGGRVVGMKKTLVFHDGRAPHGTRTNWVMHEYRLEDDELARSGISQDAYVVCRIFQKKGAGPQNGAQYGAPFIEEEWEEEEEEEKAADGLVVIPDGGDDAIDDAMGTEFLELDDFFQSEDMGNQHERAATFMVDNDGQGTGSHPEDLTALMDEMLRDPSFEENTVDYIKQPCMQSSPTLLDESGKQILLKDLAHSPSSQDDGYMELKDIGDLVNVDYLSSEGYLSYPLMTCRALNLVDGEGEQSNLHKGLEADESVDTTNQIPDWPKDNLNPQPTDPLNPLTGDCASHQQAEDMAFYDVFNDILALEQDNFIDQNGVLHSPIADPPGFEFGDELMAYFDALDNDVHYDLIGHVESLEHNNPSSIWSQSNSEVDGGNGPSNRAIPQLPNTDVGGGSSSALPAIGNQFKNKYEDNPGVPDVRENVDSNKTITHRLINMLGSVSAPPAFAAEFPASSGKFVGQHSAGAYQASPLHVSAGMIHLHSLTAASSTEDWSLQKNGNAGLLLSYSIADNVGRKSSGFGPFRKIQDWTVSLLLRGGCYPLFLSALVLTISYKVGMCVYML